MGRVGLRVGLIGAAVSLLVALLSLVPLAGNCLVWVFGLLLWAAQGALVAYWRPPRYDDVDVARAAALAGGIAVLVQGLGTILLAPVGLFLLGGTQGVLRLLPPPLFDAYAYVGVPPRALFSPPGVFLVSFLTCGLQFLFAPLVAAISAVVLARWWGESEADLWEDIRRPYMLEW